MKQKSLKIDYEILKQINSFGEIINTIDIFNNKTDLNNTFKKIANLYLQLNFPIAPLLHNKVLNNYIFLDKNFIQTIEKQNVQLVQSYLNRITDFENLNINLYNFKCNIIDAYYLTYNINKSKYISFIKKNINKFDWFNIALLFVRQSDLVAFDSDNDISTELLMSIKEFRDTLKVKTRKGYHFYFQIEDTKNIPENFTDVILFRNFQSQSYSMDIRLQSGYTILPPSKIYDHIYQWEINEIVRLKWNELQKIINKIKTYCFFKSNI